MRARRWAITLDCRKCPHFLTHDADPNRPEPSSGQAMKQALHV